MLTPIEMEQALENINRQLAAIAQILPTLATKEDLERLKSDVHLIADTVAGDSVLLKRMERQLRRRGLLQGE